MSTRGTIIYNDAKGLHIYQELLDDTIHIEVTRAGMLIDIELMPLSEWVSLGLPTRDTQTGKEARGSKQHQRLARRL
jgi:hypothetical protein